MYMGIRLETIPTQITRRLKVGLKTSSSLMKKELPTPPLEAQLTPALLPQRNGNM